MTELVTKSRDHFRRRFKDEVHVMAALELSVRDASKHLFFHLLDGLNLAASGDDIRFDAIRHVFQTLFLTGEVQYEQSFVSFHKYNLSIDSQSLDYTVVQIHRLTDSRTSPTLDLGHRPI